MHHNGIPCYWDRESANTAAYSMKEPVAVPNTTSLNLMIESGTVENGGRHP